MWGTVNTTTIYPCLPSEQVSWAIEAYATASTNYKLTASFLAETQDYSRLVLMTLQDTALLTPLKYSYILGSSLGTCHNSEIRDALEDIATIPLDQSNSARNTTSELYSGMRGKLYKLDESTSDLDGERGLMREMRAQNATRRREVVRR